jgi:hypothetical protein
MIRNTKTAREPPDPLIKYIYMKNLVVAIISKVRLLISSALYKIHPKYFHLFNDTQKNTYNKEADHNLNSRFVSSQSHSF